MKDLNENSKIKSYLGFSIKANKIVYGLDNILQYRKRIHLLVICSSAGKGLTKNLNLYAEQKEITLIETKDLAKLLSKENVKAVGLTDKNLAKAIIASEK
ncbi:MAG: hypothetical protein FWE22_08290 [Firmicutes bacterium]|nr:hypothetical protein [Bacillota bacterium]